MNSCLPLQIDGELTCPKCQVPFYLSESDLDVLNGDFTKIYRTCGTALTLEEATQWRKQHTVKVPLVGPGTCLAKRLEQIGIHKIAAKKGECDSCLAREYQMNVWGVQGCRANFDLIVEWMRANYDTKSWIEKQQIKIFALSSGLAFEFPLANWLNPIPELVELAINDAEKEQSNA